MKNIVVIGASGHAAEINEYLIALNSSSPFPVVKIEGFIDDDPRSYKQYVFSAPYLGSINDHIIRKDYYYLMGIANIRYRRTIIEKFQIAGAQFMTLVHPTAYVSESAKIGTGSILGPHVNIGPNVCVGKFTLINSRCSLGHDTTIGDFNFISPNVCFSGFTTVGEENLFGINSATLPGITIGNQNRVEAGMILHKDIGNETVVFYRYKEKIIAIPKEK